MVKKLCLLAAIGLVMLGTTAIWAQEGRIEIQPFAGYRTSGTFGVRSDVVAPVSGFRFTDGLAYGVSLGLRLTPNVTVEALWAHSDPTVRAISSIHGTPDADLFKASEDQFHANALFYFGRNDLVRPFFVTGLGVTLANPRLEGATGRTRFSWNLGLGLERWFNKRVGIRATAKWFTTYINDSAAWTVDWWGNVWLVPVSQYMGQWDFTGGLIFRF